MSRVALFVLLMASLVTASLAQAAVSGKIDSIGFGSFIRPDCWIPLVIQTTSDEDGPRSFDLQVVQHDLDGDQVVYTRPITVNPGLQSFWACFKPEPINGGIPATGAENQADLAKRLRIFLSDQASERSDPSFDRRSTQIATAGNLPQALEFGTLESTRGQKLMLVVGRMPNVNEYTLRSGKLLGTMEDAMFVRVQPKALPVDALGYDAVDAIIWTDADLDVLDAAQLRAIRQYIRSGGRLVVIQNAETQRMSKLDEFLPVHIDAVAQSQTLEPLRSILTPSGASQPLADDNGPIDLWRRVAPPFNIARATPVADAVIDTWMTWPDKTQSPYIARRLFGNGCVSWIAQDISDPSITAEPFGWPRLWERLMDWRNTDLVLTSTLRDGEKGPEAKYDSDAYKEIGGEFTLHLNSGKSAALISVAFVFFIGYWCLAGPGNYFVLAARKRAQWSWFIFGAIAVAATLLTVAVTQLVLRGAAQVQHVSMERIKSGSDEPAYVQSRFGLYLPRDERAAIGLSDLDPTAVAAITPLVIDPRPTKEASLRESKYAVPLAADDAGSTIEMTVPFRSTLKKLQATWAGKPAGRITGRPMLLDGDTPLSGQLSNNTGQDLQNVILVFTRPSINRANSDQFLALPVWKNGLTLDLAEQWKKASVEAKDLTGGPGIAISGLQQSHRGPWKWAANWVYEEMRTSRYGVGERTFNDSDSGYTRSFPLASLFDRCTPMVNQRDQNGRVEILRYGVRQWDCSAAVAGGALVVLGQADGPLPMPLIVDGDTPTGTGHTFYQCIVPLDRSRFCQPPSTQPDQE